MVSPGNHLQNGGCRSFWVCCSVSWYYYPNYAPSNIDPPAIYINYWGLRYCKLVVWSHGLIAFSHWGDNNSDHELIIKWLVGKTAVRGLIHRSYCTRVQWKVAIMKLLAGKSCNNWGFSVEEAASTSFWIAWAYLGTLPVSTSKMKNQGYSVH